MGLKKSSKPAVKKATKTKAPKAASKLKTTRKAPAMKKGGTKPKASKLSGVLKGAGTLGENIARSVPVVGGMWADAAVAKQAKDQAKREMGIPVHKRINPLNKKALNRATSRLKSFVNQVKKPVKALGYTLQRTKSVKLKRR